MLTSQRAFGKWKWNPGRTLPQPLCPYSAALAKVCLEKPKVNIPSVVCISGKGRLRLKSWDPTPNSQQAGVPEIGLTSLILVAPKFQLVILLTLLLKRRG